MKFAPVLDLLSVAPLHAAVTTTHQEFALELLDLMAETELCLAQCQDAQSVEQNLEQLEALSKKTQALAQLQKDMPYSITADYIAAEKHMREFNTLWDAIKNHIERLKADELYSEEMQKILKF